MREWTAAKAWLYRELNEGECLMKAERWQQVIDLFQSGDRRMHPKSGHAFLEEACHGDEDLRRRSIGSLTSHEKSADFY